MLTGSPLEGVVGHGGIHRVLMPEIFPTGHVLAQCSQGDVAFWGTDHRAPDAPSSPSQLGQGTWICDVSWWHVVW